MSCLHLRYIYKCINITIKQNFWGLYPAAWLKYRKYTRLRDSEGVYIIRRKTVFRQQLESQLLKFDILY